VALTSLSGRNRESGPDPGCGVNWKTGVAGLLCFWYMTVGFTGRAVIFTSREGSISTLAFIDSSVSLPEIS
jgi:hypothetical protein